LKLIESCCFQMIDVERSQFSMIPVEHPDR